MSFVGLRLMIPQERGSGPTEVGIGARISGIPKRTPDHEPSQPAILGRSQLRTHTFQEPSLQLKHALT